MSCGPRCILHQGVERDGGGQRRQGLLIFVYFRALDGTELLDGALSSLRGGSSFLSYPCLKMLMWSAHNRL